jgi:ABC-type oligopeptide transport system substrate-binding subunit
VRQPDFRTHFLRLNPTKVPFSQTKLRQIIAMSVDRDLLKESVLEHQEEKAFSILPPALNLYEPPTGFLPNRVGAKVEMKGLGYCVKGYSEKNCVTVPMINFIYLDEAESKRVALATLSSLQGDFGTRFQLKPKAPDQFLKAIRSGEFDMALDEISVEPDRAFDMLRAFTGLSPSFDEMIRSASNVLEWSDAKGIFKQAEALLLREAYLIPLYYGNTLYLLSPRIKGYEPNIWDLHPYTAISISN